MILNDYELELYGTENQHSRSFKKLTIDRNTGF
jgi:hypothetical protein